MENKEDKFYTITDKLKGTKRCHQNAVVELKGSDLKYIYFQEHGFQNPILIKDKTGLGMRVPSQNFTANDVKKCIGSKKLVEVINTSSGSGASKVPKREMSLKDWTKYFESKDKKGEVLALENLEFSGSKLETYVERPQVIQQMDWACIISTASSSSLSSSSDAGGDNEGNERGKCQVPLKVQRQCFMTALGHFDDFKVEGSGSSRWLHLLNGRLVFWLIPPSDDNYHLYEQWARAGKRTFLGDLMTSCQRLKLEAGWTFFIPSGWITATYAAEDSLAFGGLFLNCFTMTNQIKAYKLAGALTSTQTQSLSDYFKETHWFLLDSYLCAVNGHRGSRDETTPEEVGQGRLEKVAASSNEDTDIEESSMETDDVRNQNTDGKSQLPGPSSLPSTLGKQHSSPHLSNAASLSSPTSSSSSSSISGTSNIIKVVTVKLENCLLIKKQNKSKAWIHLTTYEIEGLKSVLEFLLDDGLSNFPLDSCSPHDIINGIKKLLHDHLNDQPKMAVTGKPVLSYSVEAIPCHVGISSHEVLQNKNSNLKEHQCLVTTNSTSASCDVSTDSTALTGFSAETSCSAAVGPSLSPTTDSWTTSSSVGGKDSVLRRRRVRCKKCEPCTRGECGECHFCRDMKKFGGQGKMKQTCIGRQCLAPILSTSAVCSICGKGDNIPVTSLNLAPLQMEVDVGAKANLNGEQSNAASISKLPDVGGTGCSSKVMTSQSGSQFMPHQTQERSSASAMQTPPSTVSNDLMECSICWKITHSTCLKLKYPEIGIHESQVNEDLPNSWECPVCYEAGKSGHRKTRPTKTSSSFCATNSTLAAKTEAGRKSDDDSDSGDDTIVAKTTSQCSVSSHNATNSANRASDQTTSKTKLFRRNKVSAQKELAEAKKRSRADSSHGDDGLGGKKFKTASEEETGLEHSTSYFDFSSSSAFSLSPSSCETVQPGIAISPSLSGIGPFAPKYAIRPISTLPPSKILVMADGLTNHPLKMEHWLKILAFLSPHDLCKCMLVCKTWNAWCYYTAFWKKMDISKRKVKQVHLIAVAKRQPQELDLSFSNISREQLSWLAERVFKLQKLMLTACSWAAVSCFSCSSLCPVLTHLDLSWVSQLDDMGIKGLLSLPSDNRPGVVASTCRLRNCVELILAGTDITNAAVELISKALTKLQLLDVSYCIGVTAKSVEFIAYGYEKTSLTPSRQSTPSKLQLLKCPQQSIQVQNKSQHNKLLAATTITTSSQQSLAATTSQSSSANAPASLTTSCNLPAITTDASTIPCSTATCSSSSSTVAAVAGSQVYHSPALAYQPLPFLNLKRLLLKGCSWIDGAVIEEARIARPEVEIIHVIGTEN